LKREKAPNTPLDGDSPELFQLDFELLTEVRQRLAPLILVTPLLESKVKSGVRFKPENLQRTGSFKIRPALNQALCLDEADRVKGIVTSSSGNFAQGAAYACSCLGISAKIVMMRSSNPIKVRRTRDLGAEVVFCDDRFVAREAEVEKIKKKEGRAEIHPYNRTTVVAANATIGAEICEQFAEVQNVVVPVSGGGLVAGIAQAVKLMSPSTRVWGVQPEKSNATYLSFGKGQMIEIDQPVTIADGLMVTRPGSLTFPIIQKYVDQMVVVREECILQTVGVLLREEKLVVEPSGAVTLAAVMEGLIPAENTVCVLSGGNIDPRILYAALKA
jgi:threonine dehydratase